MDPHVSSSALDVGSRRRKIPHVISHTASDFVENSPDLDSRYSWLVAFAAMLSNAFITGQLFAFGVLLQPWLTEFGYSKAQTAWVGSLASALQLAIGVFSGAIVEKFGLRKLVMISAVLIVSGMVATSFVHELWLLLLTYSFCVGAASSLTFHSGICVSGIYFLKRRSIATGMVVAGAGLGNVIIPLITQPLITSYNWRVAMRVMAGIFAVVELLPILVYRPVRHPPGYNPNRDEIAFEIVEPGHTPSTHWHYHKGYMQLLKDPFLIALLVALVFGSFGIMQPFLFVAKLSIDVLHATSSQAATTLSIIGATSTAGRFLIGIFVDRFPRSKYWAFALAWVTLGVATIFMPISGSLGVLYFLCALFGLAHGTMVSLNPILLRSFTDSKDVPKSFGLSMTAQSPVLLISGPSAGWVFAAAGYDAGFGMGGGVMCIAIIPIFVLMGLDDARARERRLSAVSIPGAIVKGDV